MSKALAVAALLLASAMAGCLGGKPPEGPAKVVETPKFTGRTAEVIEAAASVKPLRFAFPVERAPAERGAIAWFNGTFGPEANQGMEFPQDRGGTSFNAALQTQDFSSLVPEGQPTLLNIRLWYDNRPTASADLDILVDTATVRDHAAQEYAGEMAWTLPVKTKSVAIAGTGPTVIGVQAANGRIPPGQAVPFWMQIEFLYGRDVASPRVPYALQVPPNATGLVVESVKFAGDTHVQGRFLLVTPQDTLLLAMDFDDIALRTQSVFVPVQGPGEYVFYVLEARHGFFSISSDEPLDDALARPLEASIEELVLLTQPVAPGVPQHDLSWAAPGQGTPYTEGTSAAFDVASFPLEIEPFITSGGVAGDVQMRVSSPTGVVAEYHRYLRHDAAQGALGLSDDRIEENRAFRPEFLALGPHALSAVVDGMAGEQAGVRLRTFVR